MASDKELEEKNFIQEPRGSGFIWIFLGLFLIIMFLIWGVSFWQRRIENDQLAHSPFYQVTNREFSLFLWQNPRYMRSLVALPENYLGDFHTKDEIHVIPEFADRYVSAPPHVLYHYHVWRRLLEGDSLSALSIGPDSFAVFLSENKEWLPHYWKAAPEGYVELVRGLDNNRMDNLQTLSKNVFPVVVRLAYQGWYNFTREWKEIEKIEPSKMLVKEFLIFHPHYERHFWRNLYPDYLSHLNNQEGLGKRDFTDFLKVALYNFQRLQTHRDKQDLQVRY